MDFHAFQSVLLAWAKSDPCVAGVLLVGSYARGAARADSDVDLVLLSDSKAELVNDSKWTGTFGAIKSQSQENWGAVTSLRVKYASGLEVEFGMAGPNWATLRPVDPGTLRVINDGAKVIWDPKGILKDLLSQKPI
jgi:predicted nucleotidyltransferase